MLRSCARAAAARIIFAATASLCYGMLTIVGDKTVKAIIHGKPVTGSNGKCREHVNGAICRQQTIEQRLLNGRGGISRGSHVNNQGGLHASHLQLHLLVFGIVQPDEFLVRAVGQYILRHIHKVFTALGQCPCKAALLVVRHCFLQAGVIRAARDGLHQRAC